MVCRFEGPHGQLAISLMVSFARPVRGAACSRALDLPNLEKPSPNVYYTIQSAALTCQNDSDIINLIATMKGLRNIDRHRSKTYAMHPIL